MGAGGWLGVGAIAKLYPLLFVPAGLILALQRRRFITATAVGSATGTYDLDMYVYDKNCVNTLAINTAGTDESGMFGAGTAWIFLHNYAGEPGLKAFIEIKA